MCPNSQQTADLVTFTEEILNRKLHFLCSATLQFLVTWMTALSILKLKNSVEI